MRKRLVLMIAGTLLLGACGAADETTEPETEEVTDLDEGGETDTEDIGNETETESETEEAQEGPETSDEETNAGNTGDDTETEDDMSDEETDGDSESAEDEARTDQAVDLSIIMDQDFEEMNWDDVHLTRREFDASLSELQRSFNESYEEDEEMDVTINNVDFSGDTIEITLTNHDDSEYADMTDRFLAAFLDSFYRQLYLHSDYSDGDTHPRIIIQTSDGEVITDETDFTEYNIQEEIMDSMD